MFELDHPEIRIKHTLFYDIELLNPDGHISQINAHNDVRIYISEHRPLRGREGVADAMQTPSNEHLLEDLQEAPPTYNRHYLDEVFGDVEVEGFRTPGHHTPGGTYTPGHRAMSRSVSGNNPTALSSINTLAQHAHPEDLSERLNRLRDLEHPPSSHLREAESTEVSPHGSRLVGTIVYSGHLYMTILMRKVPQEGSGLLTITGTEAVVSHNPTRAKQQAVHRGSRGRRV